MPLILAPQSRATWLAGPAGAAQACGAGTGTGTGGGAAVLAGQSPR